MLLLKIPSFSKLSAQTFGCYTFQAASNIIYGHWRRFFPVNQENFEVVYFFPTQTQHLKTQIDMFIQSGPMKLNFLYSQRTCRSDLELNCPEMVNESVLPFTGALVSTPKTIYWFFWSGNLLSGSCAKE